MHQMTTILQQKATRAPMNPLCFLITKEKECTSLSHFHDGTSTSPVAIVRTAEKEINAIMGILLLIKKNS